MILPILVISLSIRLSVVLAEWDILVLNQAPDLPTEKISCHLLFFLKYGLGRKSWHGYRNIWALKGKKQNNDKNTKARKNIMSRALILSLQ